MNEESKDDITGSDGLAPNQGPIDLTMFRRIDRTALVIGAIAVVASLASGNLRFIGGTAVGAAIGWGNLQVIRFLVERAVRQPEQRRAVMAAFGIKFTVLLMVVTVVVLVTNVDLIGFLIGISSTVVSASLVPLLNPLFPGNRPAAAEPPSHSTRNE